MCQEKSALTSKDNNTKSFKQKHKSEADINCLVCQKIPTSAIADHLKKHV